MKKGKIVSKVGKNKKFGISWYISFIVMIEITVLLMLVGIGSRLLAQYVETIWNVPTPIWAMILGVLIGLPISVFINRALMAPVRKIGRAMNQVAGGNYKVHLEPKSHFSDVQDMYQNFNLMTKELASTEILKNDFISNVSHEIKTPINAIEGYAMLLQDDAALSEEQSECVEKILLNTKRLSDLIGNILLLSKLDNQAIETKQTIYRLDEQIRQSILLLELKWTDKNLELDVDLERIDYEGNSSMMLLVWNNLIGNAIKFTPPQTTVKIRLYEQKENIVFSVEDCGCGIDETIKERVFDKFYQADTSHKQEGNGLGLTLTKRILDMVNGTISIENLPICGCYVCVTLPRTF